MILNTRILASPPNKDPDLRLFQLYFANNMFLVAQSTKIEIMVTNNYNNNDNINNYRLHKLINLPIIVFS